MAGILGAIATSHVPAIGRAIAKRLQQDPYWNPFFDSGAPVRRRLAGQRPDAGLVFCNDHGLNFLLDRWPAFAVGAAPGYRNADEGWGIPRVLPFAGDTPLSWHLIDALIGQDFDLATCREMRVDHAITNPLALMFPGRAGPVRIGPVRSHTGRFPLPSARRCHAPGEAVGRAMRSWQGDARVVVLGSDGLSHQLAGQRAGSLHRDFDLAFLESLIHDPHRATRLSTWELAEKAGTPGLPRLIL